MRDEAMALPVDALERPTVTVRDAGVLGLRIARRAASPEERPAFEKVITVGLLHSAHLDKLARYVGVLVFVRPARARPYGVAGPRARHCYREGRPPAQATDEASARGTAGEILEHLARTPAPSPWIDAWQRVWTLFRTAYDDVIAAGRDLFRDDDSVNDRSPTLHTLNVANRASAPKPAPQPVTP